MLERIQKCFERLQQLNVPPTETNMSILLQTLYDLRDVYNELKGKNEDAKT